MTTPRLQTASIPPSYFEKKYQEEIDPWHFRTSAYEREKYDATIEALSKLATAMRWRLAARSGSCRPDLRHAAARLLAVDASPTAIAEAARQDLPNVRFAEAVMPQRISRGLL